MTPRKSRPPRASIRQLPTPGSPDPHAELVAMRERLGEAEETLRAIRSGEVDALVVTTRIGEQIFTLRSAEQPYRLFVEGMSEGAATLAGDGTILYSNARLADMMAAPLERVTGAVFGDFVAAVQQATFAALLARGKHERCTGEFELVAAGGASVTVQLSAQPLETDGLSGICVVVTDITTRKRAEDGLRESESRYRRLHESMSDAFVEVNMDGRIQDCNRAYEQLVGYSRDELRDLAYVDLSPEKWRAAEARIVAEQVVPRGHSDAYEKEYRRKDGRIVPVELKRFLLRNEAGTPAGMWGIVRDIGERKQAEETLQRTAIELARSNAELQQFAYVVSHDLQEPLRMVSSYMDLLASRYRGRLDADADDFIAFAIEGATRMQQLIKDLLDYSRVGSRPKELAPTACDTVLGHVLDNLRVAIDAAHAVITHDALPTVVADSVQLAQVLQNLIGNALKFHDKLSPRVHVSAERHDGAWRFAVRDNGIGMDPQHFERIFVIFQRLHSRGAYPGTGIGLAISKRIVERHGGRIWVESAPGQGSTFFFTIPDGAVEAVRQ